MLERWITGARALRRIGTLMPVRRCVVGVTRVRARRSPQVQAVKRDSIDVLTGGLGSSKRAISTASCTTGDKTRPAAVRLIARGTRPRPELSAPRRVCVLVNGQLPDLVLSSLPRPAHGVVGPRAGARSGDCDGAPRGGLPGVFGARHGGASRAPGRTECPRASAVGRIQLVAREASGGRSTRATIGRFTAPATHRPRGRRTCGGPSRLGVACGATSARGTAARGSGGDHWRPGHSGRRTASANGAIRADWRTIGRARRQRAAHHRAGVGTSGLLRASRRHAATGGRELQHRQRALTRNGAPSRPVYFRR